MIRMNRHVSAITSRLSLRPPQQHSLEILSRICEILPPKKGTDLAAGLATIQSEFPTITSFEREFPSLCFSLATGVGKTRLMGAFVSYLYLAHGIKNFFVLAPNLTIYNKLITDFTPNTPKYVLKGIAEFAIAQIAHGAMLKLENCPDMVPTTAHLLSPEVQTIVREAVAQQYDPAQLELEGVTVQPDVAAIVAQTASLMIQETIDIPRILVLPTGEVKSGFRPFTLELTSLNYPPPSDELWIQHLRTNQLEIIGLQKGDMDESRLENYVVSGLVDLDDIAYDEHSDLLYDLAGQVARHFCTYLSEDNARKVLRLYQRDIARFVHTQMLEHFWEAAVDYEVKVSRGFTALKPSAYTTAADESLLDYRQSPTDKSNMAKYLFGGFSKCLYSVQKFQSDTERTLSVVLEREAIKWFKPAKGQFQIYYRWNGDRPEYQPDFVAETDDLIYMLEPKRRSEMDAAEVLAKKAAAVKWCQQASTYMQSNGGKPWSYILIPHDAIAQNMTLKGLADRFQVD